MGYTVCGLYEQVLIGVLDFPGVYFNDSTKAVHAADSDEQIYVERRKTCSSMELFSNCLNPPGVGIVVVVATAAVLSRATLIGVQHRYRE